MGFPDAKWAVDQIVSKVGVQPNNMRKFKVIAINATTLGLQFLEPEDSYYSEGGALAAVTKGVVIRMSTEGYPQSVNDGVFIVDNTTLGAYENESFVVEGLTEGTTYYFTAFPYSNVGVYNESLNQANKAEGVPNSIETIKVSVNIDNDVRFTSAVVSLVNNDTGVTVTSTVEESGVVIFEAEAYQTYHVEISEVVGYKIDSTSSGSFVSEPANERSISFNYEVGFLYSIEFDNGADGASNSYVYSDDCEGFEPVLVNEMNGWENERILEFFRPCVIKPSALEPEYYLSKSNYNYRDDGVTASVLTGNDGDVMVEVKKMYYKVEKLTNTIKLSISELKLNDSYKCFTEVDGVEEDVVYRGVYEASVSNSVMRSVSGVAPTVSQTRAAFRTNAKNRGDEYSQNDYYLLFLWQCMYIMLYGNRSAQEALGKGRTSSSNTAGVNTGTMNDKPFCWGDTTATNGVKFLGVEHFYGDRWEFVDGLTLVDYVYKITRDRSKYDDVGTSYETSVSGAPTTSDSYIKSVKGVEDAIFLPNTVGGSEITYFCDNYWVNSGTRVAIFGGSWYSAGRAGAFCLDLTDDASSSVSSIGSRLCRKKVAS